MFVYVSVAMYGRNIIDHMSKKLRKQLAEDIRNGKFGEGYDLKIDEIIKQIEDMPDETNVGVATFHKAIFGGINKDNKKFIHGGYRHDLNAIICIETQAVQPIYIESLSVMTPTGEWVLFSSLFEEK